MVMVGYGKVKGGEPATSTDDFPHVFFISSDFVFYSSPHTKRDGLKSRCETYHTILSMSCNYLALWGLSTPPKRWRLAQFLYFDGRAIYWTLFISMGIQSDPGRAQLAVAVCHKRNCEGQRLFLIKGAHLQLFSHSPFSSR
jgi:hypothetical protein